MVQLSGAGQFYANDSTSGADRVLRFSGDGLSNSVFATGIAQPLAVAVDAHGNVYVVQTISGSQIHIFAPNGTLITSFGSGTFIGPRGVAIDSQGRVIVADFNSVKIFSPSSPLVPETAPEFDVPPTPSTSDIIVFPVDVATRFAIRASDANADDLVTISIVGVPISLGATFVTTGGNPATGDFSWRPGTGDLGDHVLTFTATDDSPGMLSSQSHRITIRVIRDETAPEFDTPPTPTSGGTISVPVGGTANFNVRASDIDSGDLVTITVTGTPFGRGATFVTGPGNPATGVFSWTPGSGDVGGYVLTLTATDNSPSQLSSQRTVVVRVLLQPVGSNCRGLTPTIVGTPGPDILIGTSGDDVIVGLGGNDTIFGRGGNDTICGNQGDDVLIGGDGADWIAGGRDNDLIQGNRGNDHLIGGPGADILAGGPGADLVRGGGGNDQVAGGEDDDVLYGGVGSDKLLGGPGDDVLLGHRGQDSLDCGAGFDIGDGGPHRDTGINCEVQQNVEA